MGAYKSKYLTFTLDQYQYAIPVQDVKQITGITGITNIPVKPKTIKGFINLKGKIIPVMDLRMKLDLGYKPFTQRTYIIVTKFQVGDIKKQIGIAVDYVTEVVTIEESEIENKKDKWCELVKKVGKIEEKEILLLNIQELLNVEEIDLLKQT